MSKKICVITGGGSGMDLATAARMGKDHYVILCGRTVSKLENAIADLQKKGVECEAFHFDVSDRASVRKLDKHAAGVSLHMGNA